MGSGFEVSKGRLLYEKFFESADRRETRQECEGKVTRSEVREEMVRLNEEIELAILFEVPYYLYRSRWSVRK